MIFLLNATFKPPYGATALCSAFNNLLDPAASRELPVSWLRLTASRLTPFKLGVLCVRQRTVATRLAR